MVGSKVAALMGESGEGNHHGSYASTRNRHHVNGVVQLESEPPGRNSPPLRVLRSLDVPTIGNLELVKGETLLIRGALHPHWPRRSRPRRETGANVTVTS